MSAHALRDQIMETNFAVRATWARRDEYANVAAICRMIATARSSSRVAQCGAISLAKHASGHLFDRDRMTRMSTIALTHDFVDPFRKGAWTTEFPLDRATAAK
jgi:hypothetical protein